jgi:hypothetical protein
VARRREGRGFLVSKVLSAVRKKMLRVGLPALLDALDDDFKVRRGGHLEPNA